MDASKTILAQFWHINLKKKLLYNQIKSYQLLMRHIFSFFAIVFISSATLVAQEEAPTKRKLVTKTTITSSNFMKSLLLQTDLERLLEPLVLITISSK